MFAVVIRHPNKQFEMIAHTKHYEDAEAVLSNWDSGYIVSDGDIKKTKGDPV